MAHPRIIYKIMTAAEWEAAQGEGVYRGSAHDARDGFIHFSTAAQLPETARKFFSGAHDLVLLAVEIDALRNAAFAPHPDPLPWGEGRGEGSALRWEPSRGGDLFPHLYGELAASAVAKVWPLRFTPDGAPLLPEDLAS